MPSKRLITCSSKLPFSPCALPTGLAALATAKRVASRAASVVGPSNHMPNQACSPSNDRRQVLHPVAKAIIRWLGFVKVSQGNPWRPKWLRRLGRWHSTRPEVINSVQRCSELIVESVWHGRLWKSVSRAHGKSNSLRKGPEDWLLMAA